MPSRKTYTAQLDMLLHDLGSGAAGAQDAAHSTLRAMAHDADQVVQAVRKDRTAHPVGSRVEVLEGFQWVPGTVHKRIYDDKLTFHDHGPVITTVTWVVWLDDQRWWRGDMAEHIRALDKGVL
jgi:hypothetical protein